MGELVTVVSPVPAPLRIRSAQGDYTVTFFEDLAAVARGLSLARRLALVIDAIVARLYADQLAELFGAVPTLTIDATEEEKSLAGVARVATWLQDLGADRRTTLIALGGGIVQDICALTAHLYHRGIAWVFVPTTLLAMGDSCIGAKCGVNLRSFKNQLGAFHSPAHVLITTDFVHTLSDRDVASGYGEMLKLMLIGSGELFEQFRALVERSGLRNPSLGAIVRDSLEVKRPFIEEDEHDLGVRRTLNYGHTFGHALEAVTDYEVPHGLAVAWGLDLVNFLAVRRGLLAPPIQAAIHEFITAYLPFGRARPVNARSLVEAATRDKKAAAREVSLVVLERPGSLRIVQTPLDRTLEEEIALYLDTLDAHRA